MSRGELIPDIIDGEPFPFGDSTSPARELGAERWLATMEQHGPTKYLEIVNKLSWPTVIIGYQHGLKTNTAAVALAQSWDSRKRDDRSRAQMGYRAGSAFNRTTTYLPGFNVNLSDDLDALQHSREVVHDVPQFAHEVWMSMKQYPNVLSKYERLHEMTARALGERSLDDRWQIQAGLALAFKLSSTAQFLLSNSAEFTSMAPNDGSMIMQEVRFTQFFNNEVDLAPDVTLRMSAEGQLTRE